MSIIHILVTLKSLESHDLLKQCNTEVDAEYIDPCESELAMVLANRSKYLLNLEICLGDHCRSAPVSSTRSLLE